MMTDRLGAIEEFVVVLNGRALRCIPQSLSINNPVDGLASIEISAIVLSESAIGAVRAEEVVAAVVSALGVPRGPAGQRQVRTGALTDQEET